VGRRAAFFPDSERLLVSVPNDRLEIRNANTGDVLRVIPFFKSEKTFKLNLAPDGRHFFAVVTGTSLKNDGTSIGLWEVDTGRCIASFYDDNIFHILDAEFSPDSSMLIFTGIPDAKAEGTKLVDTASGKILGTLEKAGATGNRNDMQRATFTSDNSPVTCNVALTVYDRQTLRPIHTQSFDPKDGEYMHVRPDGKHILASKSLGAGNYDFSEWDISGNAPPRMVIRFLGQCAPSVSPDGKYLSSVDRAPFYQHVNVWDTYSGKCLGSCVISREVAFMTYYRTFFLADSKRFVGPGTDAHTLGIYDARSCDLLATLPQETNLIDLVAAPNGRYLATLSGDGFVRIWKKVGPESVLGPLIFPSAIVLALSIAMLTWSLLRDARRTDSLQLCHGAELKWVVYPLVVLGTFGVFKLIIEVANSIWIWNPVPIYLIWALALATGNRVWRIVVLSLLIPNIIWLVWLCYLNWQRSHAPLCQFHVFDRSYFLTREGALIVWGIWLIWLVVAALIIFQRFLRPSSRY
jgi:WD40 repeat protein